MAANDQDNWRPVPTRLVQFEQVQQQDQGSKIRFLGCVQAYHGEIGTLALAGAYGIAKDANLVNVNIDQILESVNHQLLQVGAWLNVVGYIRKHNQAAESPVSKSGNQLRRSTRLARSVAVDAIMLWSAGTIKLNDYKSAVRSYQRAMPLG